MEKKNKGLRNYFATFFGGLTSLLVGMKTSSKVYFRKKITEQYPENRAELKMFDRFRGSLYFLENDGHHFCVSCKLCERACPNGTIEIKSAQEEMEDGKKRMVLQDYRYDLGSCIFCQLCVNVCPHDAIDFNQEFEHAVFNRSLLEKHLNDGLLPPEPKKKKEAATEEKQIIS